MMPHHKHTHTHTRTRTHIKILTNTLIDLHATTKLQLIAQSTKKISSFWPSIGALVTLSALCLNDVSHSDLHH